MSSLPLTSNPNIAAEATVAVTSPAVSVNISRVGKINRINIIQVDAEGIYA